MHETWYLTPFAALTFATVGAVKDHRLDRQKAVASTSFVVHDVMPYPVSSRLPGP